MKKAGNQKAAVIAIGAVVLAAILPFLYPFLSLRSGTKRYENVFLSLFFLYNSSYRELGILQITGR